METLSTLPRTHPDRLRPLSGCYYLVGKRWHQILPSFRIAKNCFNDLGPAWTDHSEFCWEPKAK